MASRSACVSRRLSMSSIARARSVIARLRLRMLLRQSSPPAIFENRHRAKALLIFFLLAAEGLFS